MNYLYAKLNKQVEDVKYKGVNTPTISMDVNSAKKEISANVRMDTAVSSSSTRPVSGKTVKGYVDSRVTVPAPSASYSELITKLKIGGTTYMLPAGDSVGFEGNTVVIDTPDTEPAQEIHDIVIMLVLTQNSDLIQYVVTDKTANRELTYNEFAQIVRQRNPQQVSHISFDINHVDFTSYINADSISYTPLYTISGEGLEASWGNAIDRRVVFAFGSYGDTASVGIYSRDAFPTTYRPWSSQVNTSVSWISTGEMSIEADPQATQLPREVPFATSILTLPSSLVLVYDDDTYVMELHDSGNPLDWYYTADGVDVTVTRDAIMIPDKEAHTVDFKAQTSEFENDSLTIRCDNAFSTSNGYIRYFDANGETVTQQLSATVNDISGVMGLKSFMGADGYIWVEIGCDNGAQLLSSSSYESYKIDGENAWLCRFPVSDNVADITLITNVLSGN